MAKHNGRILLVEDDKNLGFMLKEYLEMESFKVDLKENGELGYKAFKKKEYDLCILDVMMPVMDGFTLAKKIKEENDKIPFIYLTAKNLQEDKIRGLKSGADDYMTKPFSTEELLLRIQAILKRTRNTELNQEQTTFEFGAFTFDYSNQMLTWAEGSQPLTRKEAEVLNLLCLNMNSILKRETALKLIWGENDYFMGRSMDVYITKLRKFLGVDPRVSITNVHNTGFKLEVANNE